MMRVWGRDYQFDRPMKGEGVFRKTVRKKKKFFCIIILAIFFYYPSGTEMALEAESLSGNQH